MAPVGYATGGREREQVMAAVQERYEGLMAGGHGGGGKEAMIESNILGGKVRLIRCVGGNSTYLPWVTEG